MTAIATDPSDFPTLEQMKAMSGLEFMTGILEGRLPAAPIAAALDYTLESVSAGQVVFAGTPGFGSYNPIGSVHGGWFGTLLDSCMACSIHTMLPAGQAYTTLEYKINILRGATTKTGRLRAIGEVTRVGRRTGVAEGRIVDDSGKTFATGSTTCLVFDL